MGLLWEHHPTGRFVSPLFLLCFQMALIIPNIEMDVAFEPNVPNNRILLRILDRTLAITIIHD